MKRLQLTILTFLLLVFHASASANVHTEVKTYDAVGKAGEQFTVYAIHRAVIENKTNQPQQYEVSFRISTVGARTKEETYSVQLAPGQRYDKSYSSSLPLIFADPCEEGHPLIALTVIRPKFGPVISRAEHRVRIVVVPG